MWPAVDDRSAEEIRAGVPAPDEIGSVLEEIRAEWDELTERIRGGSPPLVTRRAGRAAFAVKSRPNGVPTPKDDA